jgi:hypothetical protein
MASIKGFRVPQALRDEGIREMEELKSGFEKKGGEDGGVEWW